MNETEKQPASMIFTLEDDNDAAPVYENKSSNWEDSLNAIRNRYRRSEEILAAHRAKLAGVAESEDELDAENELAQEDEQNHHLDDVPKSTETDEEPEFRLPEIEMPDADREYRLDDIDDEQESSDMLMTDANSTASIQAHSESNQDDDDDEDDEAALSKLFKRYQAEREQSPIQPKPKPILPPALTQPESELAQGYAAFLAHRQHEHNQRVTQGVIAEEDIGVLIQEDWVAAQSALRTDQKSNKILNLHAQYDGEEPVYRESVIAEPLPNLPAITVHVYDLPDLPSTRKIKVLSEKELVATLQQKLRPHLSNAVAGLMHHVLQKKLATLSYDLQMMLNEETPRLVEDVLAHNMETILKEIKEKM